ncbi:MAG: tetratricopeptide repeat protein [Bdellovibrionaceae bacterium]|nr:tetratricopeptide repeat protein [Bdellovibrio sp.]
MKKLIIMAALAFVSACATSEKREKPAAEENYEDTAIASTKPVDYKDDVVIAKEEKLPAATYTALNEAIRQQNDDQIQKACSEILTQNSKDTKALNALALVYYKKGRFEAAHYLLNKALSANPNSAEIYGNIGTVLLAKNERREAVKSFRKALQLNPDDAMVGANLGAIYVQEKDYTKALLALEVAVSKGMKDVKVLNNYAVALTAKGRTKEAADFYEKILKENPSQKEAMLNYSILLIEVMNKNKEGLDLLNRLKFVGPSAESRQVIKQLENKAKAALQ